MRESGGSGDENDEDLTVWHTGNNTEFMGAVRVPQENTRDAYIGTGGENVWGGDEMDRGSHGQCKGNIRGNQLKLVGSSVF